MSVTPIYSQAYRVCSAGDHAQHALITPVSQLTIASGLDHIRMLARHHLNRLLDQLALFG